MESFLTLNALGGDCLEGFDALRVAAGVTQRTGCQAALAMWAEMNVVLAGEFRDGSLPPLRVAHQAWTALPDTVDEDCFRGDSA